MDAETSPPTREKQKKQFSTLHGVFSINNAIVVINRRALVYNVQLSKKKKNPKYSSVQLTYTKRRLIRVRRTFRHGRMCVVHESFVLPKKKKNQNSPYRESDGPEPAVRVSCPCARVCPYQRYRLSIWNSASNTQRAYTCETFRVCETIDENIFCFFSPETAQLYWQRSYFSFRNNTVKLFFRSY